MPDNEEHSLHQATIVSRAGKSTGKYCNWYNVQFALPESKSGQETALDLGNVLELTVHLLYKENYTNKIEHSQICQNEIFKILQ